MKIEDLKEVNILTQYINGIDDFMDKYDNSKSIEIGNGAFLLGIKKGQEHEIISALQKIKSNMIEQLKELGVEVWLLITTNSNDTNTENRIIHSVIVTSVVDVWNIVRLRRTYIVSDVRIVIYIR